MNFFTIMATLTYNDLSNNAEKEEVRLAGKELENMLYQYTLITNFHKIVLYNEQGHFFSSRIDFQPKLTEVTAIINTLDWLEKGREKFGKLIIIPPYDDPWSSGKKDRVFSVSRAIPGINEVLGFIEVQKLYSDIERILYVTDEEFIELSVFTEEGGELFGGSKTFENYIESVHTSKYSGLILTAHKDRRFILNNFYNSVRNLLLISIVIIVISISFIYIASVKLTKPVRELTSLIEQTELETLNEYVKISNSDSEFEKLGNSFLQLKSRLNSSIQKEIKTSALQQQARFDALQAQVNPHFLFNILNVISRMGLESNNEEICEVSNGIADMLRYSTSTISRNATIREEIDHIYNYLSLLKKRYEDKLQFSIELEEELMDITVPKITLQPLVENCINHGFNKNNRQMIISIKGWISHRLWYLEILDNGDGFSAKILNELKGRIDRIESKTPQERYMEGMKPGGLGLVNTFGRLSLYFNGKISINVSNRNDKSGAIIILSGEIS
ncbi:MAG: hypothetical protein B6241_13005 [Spirochaetaceae bacterium 4572_59]|nr:MAG: hypothetical protein B6241_13005 [Spirochaetaceae bacterium 4572_59]